MHSLNRREIIAATVCGTAMATSTVLAAAVSTSHALLRERRRVYNALSAAWEARTSTWLAAAGAGEIGVTTRDELLESICYGEPRGRILLDGLVSAWEND